jgi:hypothetical protein
MTSTRILVLSAFVFFLHALEEYITSFYTTDPTVVWLGALLTLSPILTWLSVQVLLISFLVALYLFRSQKILWWVLLLVMLTELYHPLLALLGRSYSGVLTSLFFIPLMWLIYRFSPLFRPTT